MKNSSVSAYIENVSVFLLGIGLITFPILFSTLTTEVFTLPKQIIISVMAIILLFLYGIKVISDGRVVFKRTIFDLPLIIFLIIAGMSAYFSINRYDVIINYLPLLFSIIIFFSITNYVKSESSILFIIASVIAGGCISAVLFLLSIFGINIFPVSQDQIQILTTLGSLMDQSIYLCMLIPVSIYSALILGKGKESSQEIKKYIFIASAIIIIIGAIATIYKLFTLPINSGGLTLLPFQIGFQTSLAAISQDTGRLLQGFLFGSGFGTYATDFTRFKPVTINLDPTLWSLLFFKSSSFIFEILSTTGVLGLSAFIFLSIRFVKEGLRENQGNKNPLFVSLIIAIIASMALPFTFTIQTIIFVLLGLFASIQGLHLNDKFFDVEIDLVTLRKGIFATSTLEDPLHLTAEEKKIKKILPAFIFVAISSIVVGLGYITSIYVLADLAFQRSFIFASKNDGSQTYNEQTKAIRLFPYKDSFYRVYSQTNLSLAISVASSIQKDSSPSAKTQQTINTLIQQSINSARNATTISPLSSSNWQNISFIYKDLIGYVKDAERFAILTNQQAISIDPNNPQQYLNLGSIYYQLGQWDNAVHQFQIAITLKNDLSNAYYNLGHALEQKGDVEGALLQYQAVKTIVAKDEKNVKQITKEIEDLTARVNNALKKQTPIANPEGTIPSLDNNSQPNVSQLPTISPLLKVINPSPSPVQKK
ncbi:MAG: tetratricopeptide repeat protein [Candidatus Levybacteria bacterium]|nr:tetratricopeptide repeat protein [Candidatus Levybacteria bacterium]